MVALESFQYTGLTQPFIFLTFGLSGLGLSARVPGCQKIQKGRLDRYGPKRFGRLSFATIRKVWD